MRRRSRTTLLIILGALVLAGVVAASWITLPYYGLGPGPTREVTPLISFEGPERHEPTGALVMTTLRAQQLTPLTALAAWLDPEVEIAHEDLLYAPGVDPEEEDRISFSQMDESKIDATYVVLERLTGYPREHGSGALIESTAPRCPADGELFPGDIVTAIDGEPVDSREEASRLIEGTPEGREMRFALDVDGTPEEAVFARESCVDGSDPLVGVRMLNTFPFPVAISSGDVGGPSAGLMWAVGLYELLTPGDLTGGEVVAGTGTIDLDGRVGGIGGIVDKVLGAENAGASVFLMPASNLEELAGLDTGDMRVVPVETFDQALAALREASAQA